MGCGCKEKKLTSEKRNNELREKSGNVIFSDALTYFLYQLMDEHLSAGEVEELVLSATKNKDILFNNGWLAKYANNLAYELTNANNRFSDIIQEAFGNPIIKETSETSNEPKVDQKDMGENEKIIDGLVKAGQISGEEAIEMKKELEELDKIKE